VHETHQQIADHLRMREQAFVTGIVDRHPVFPLPKPLLARSARGMRDTAERCHEILAEKPARPIGRQSR
jgi:hypothetical protein